MGICETVISIFIIISLTLVVLAYIGKDIDDKNKK